MRAGIEKHFHDLNLIFVISQGCRRINALILGAFVKPVCRRFSQYRLPAFTQYQDNQDKPTDPFHNASSEGPDLFSILFRYHK